MVQAGGAQVGVAADQIVADGLTGGVEVGREGLAEFVAFDAVAGGGGQLADLLQERAGVGVGQGALFAQPDLRGQGARQSDQGDDAVGPVTVDAAVALEGGG